jgi:hypothetical protein
MSEYFVHELLSHGVNIAVNHSKDYMAARKLIADRARPDTEKLADPQISLRDAVAT